MFYYIPDAALAAVIIMAVTDMINFSMVKHLYSINSMSLAFPMPSVAISFETFKIIGQSYRINLRQEYSAWVLVSVGIPFMRVIAWVLQKGHVK